MRDRLVVGTRRSRLATVQTESVCATLRELHPHVEVEIREITTSGDRRQDVPLAETGTTGVFTREIERRLLDGDIDFAVHSLKDLPVQMPGGLVLAATPTRASACDALVCREALSLADLPAGAVVGTSSPRRAAQVLATRPDLKVSDLRGNVDTRVEKLRSGGYDAIVLAAAGLERLGMADVITEMLDYGVFLPAPGQGALAIQAREGDNAVIDLLSAMNDEATNITTRTERMLLAMLGGDCHLPMGALARCVGEVTPCGRGLTPLRPDPLPGERTACSHGARGDKEAVELVLGAVVVSPDGSVVIRVESSGFVQNPNEVVDKCYGDLSLQGVARLIP